MPLIDRTTFDDLKQMSGAEFINELIDAFLEDAPTMLENLRTAVAGGDEESFRRNAHSIKSNATTFGATELAGLAKELEVMARQGNFEVGDRLEALRDAYDRVAAELKEMRI